MKTRTIIASFIAAAFICSCGNADCYDIVVIGGGTSGTAAAIQAARSGASVLLVEETGWLGGMLTSAGVSATDGCYKLRGGLWAEFRDSLEQEYGGPDGLKTGWVSNVMFEPSIGNRIFCNMAAKEKTLEVKFYSIAGGFVKTASGWELDVAGKGGDSRVNKVRTSLLIDATELGDVAKAVGVICDKGMDSRKVTGEDIAPENANGIIQDLTYVLILKDFGHPVPVPEPDNYTPSEFACACMNTHCLTPKEKDRMWSPEEMITYGKLPGEKYMLNWPIEGNDFYADMTGMDEVQRDSVSILAKERSLRFLYFIQNELGMKNLGIADEFPTDDGFPLIPYHRESRRIQGIVRFSLNDITAPYDRPQQLYRTTIAVGDYPVDQHHTRYEGWEELPNLYFHAVPSYGVPAGVMIPRDIRDMLVIEKSISVTNLVNGTTRLQPVVLQLGQAAGILAANAVKSQKTPADVSVREVQSSLLEAGAYILPLLDLPVGSPYFKALQRIAATGIIRYEGRTEGWENQSWLNAAGLMQLGELVSGFRYFYEGLERKDGTLISFRSGTFGEMFADVRSAEHQAGNLPAGSKARKSSAIGTRVAGVEDLASLVAAVSGEPEDKAAYDIRKILSLGEGEGEELTRLQCAVALDAILDPFGSYDVDMYGNLVTDMEE